MGSINYKHAYSVSAGAKSAETVRNAKYKWKIYFL